MIHLIRDSLSAVSRDASPRYDIRISWKLISRDAIDLKTRVTA